jgi:dipeptidyl-peptidase-4
MKFSLLIVVHFVFIILIAQPGVPSTKWTPDGSSYYAVEKREIVKIELPSQNKTVFITRKQLITKNADTLNPRSFQLSADGKLALIYTNAQKVWRYPTRGDYWLLNLGTGDLKQMGKGRSAASLQFAKFSPDSRKIAYVSERNIYTEDLATGVIKKLTSDNGT